MNYSSRVFLYGPLVVVLTIAAAISFHWWRSTSAFEDRLAAMKGREAIPGVTLDWSSVAISGFPFRVDAVFENFSARGEGAHGPFRWESGRLALHSLAYGADRKVFEAAGAQRLNWTDAAERPQSLAFQVGSLRASAIRDADGLARFDAEAVGVVSSQIALGKAQFHMRRGEGGNTIDMVASADAASGDMGFAFGKTFKAMTLYQTLHRAEAYAALLKGEASPKAAHEAWHAKGGTANVTATEFNGKKNGMSIEQGMMINALLEALY
jgi:hypothetical protein